MTKRDKVLETWPRRGQKYGGYLAEIDAYGIVTSPAVCFRYIIACLHGNFIVAVNLQVHIQSNLSTRCDRPSRHSVTYSFFICNFVTVYILNVDGELVFRHKHVSKPHDRHAEQLIHFLVLMFSFVPGIITLVTYSASRRRWYIMTMSKHYSIDVALSKSAFSLPKTFSSRLFVLFLKCDRSNR